MEVMEFKNIYIPEQGSCLIQVRAELFRLLWDMDYADDEVTITLKALPCLV